MSSPTKREYVSIRAAAATLQEKMAESFAVRQAERAGYLGECFDCKDTGWQWEDYPCRHCDRGRELRAQQEREATEARYRALVTGMALPPRCRDFTFDTYPAANRAARTIVANAVAAWDFRQSLFLFGPYGIGKTGLLVAALHRVARTYAERGTVSQIRFVSAPQLFRDLRAGYADNSYDRTLESVTAPGLSLLALDDLGAEKPTDWVREQLYLIVNTRYDRQQPIWITSNLSLGELEDRIGERVVSRLSEMCAVLPLGGKNLRSR